MALCSEWRPVLSDVVPAFKLFMTAWEMLGKKHLHPAPFMQVSVEWAVKYYERMDLSKVYIVAMGKWTCSYFAFGT
jgi:hypothetical protein